MAIPVSWKLSSRSGISVIFSNVDHTVTCENKICMNTSFTKMRLYVHYNWLSPATVDQSVCTMP